MASCASSFWISGVAIFLLYRGVALSMRGEESDGLTLRPQPWPLRRILMILGAAGLVCAASVFFRAAAHDNPPLGDAVGAIDGESISVEGPMSEQAEHGRAKTSLRRGCVF